MRLNRQELLYYLREYSDILNEKCWWNVDIKYNKDKTITIEIIGSDD